MGNKAENQEDIQKVMRRCNCLSNAVITKAKKIYGEANGDMDKFLELLNQNHIGGGHLHIQNDTIIGIYTKYYCGVPKNVKAMPACYCECSAGWFEKLFSSVLGKEVCVNLKHTILDGHDKCMFEIKWSV